MASKTYTAKEMRAMADKLDDDHGDCAICLYDTRDDEWRPLWRKPNSVVLALRQAADAMEHNDSLLSKAGETVVGLMNKTNAQNEEIKNLRAALKPVLECDTDFDICGAIEEGDVGSVTAPFDAVNKAQRIYSEGEVKK